MRNHHHHSGSPCRCFVQSGKRIGFPGFLSIFNLCLTRVLLVAMTLPFSLSSQEIIEEPPIVASVNEPSLRSYQLRPGDQVRIIVYGQEDLSVIQRIDAEGHIQMPLLGRVEIGGLTTSSCKEMLESELISQRYLRLPRVSISVEEYASKSVSVLGQVKKPGKIDFDPSMKSMDIVQAIALAGDFTGIAKRSDVIVTRISDEGLEEKFSVDVRRKIMGNKNEESLFLIYPGDVVFVPESLF